MERSRKSPLGREELLRKAHPTAWSLGVEAAEIMLQGIESGGLGGDLDVEERPEVVRFADEWAPFTAELALRNDPDFSRVDFETIGPEIVETVTAALRWTLLARLEILGLRRATERSERARTALRYSRIWLAFGTLLYIGLTTEYWVGVFPVPPGDEGPAVAGIVLTTLIWALLLWRAWSRGSRLSLGVLAGIATIQGIGSFSIGDWLVGIAYVVDVGCFAAAAALVPGRPPEEAAGGRP